MIWKKTAIAGLQAMLVTTAAAGCTEGEGRRDSADGNRQLARAAQAIDRADASTESPPDELTTLEVPGELRTIDFRAPEADDPDGRRRPAEDEPLEASSPTADEALGALRNSLFAVLRSEGGNMRSRAEVESALDMLDGFYRGDTALAESELCVTGQGLPRALDELRAVSEVDAVRNALGVVCSLDVEFGKGDAQPWKGSGIYVNPLDEADCADIDIRVPNLPGLPTEYRMTGYMLNIASNLATFEVGQIFVANARCAPREYSSSAGAETTTTYGVSLTLKYKNQKGEQKVVEIGDFLGDGATTPIPSDINLGAGPQTGELLYQTVRRSCDPAGLACVNKPLGLLKSQPFTVAKLGTLCSANLAYNQFAINDRKKAAGEWLSNRVKSLSLDPSFADWNPTFHAFARTIKITTDGATSSYPQYGEIVDGNKFAVHKGDRLSLYRKPPELAEDPTEDELKAFQTELQTELETYLKYEGTTNLSALRYPRVVTNNFGTGELFSYSCTPNKIVRDYVAFCSEVGKGVDSMFLLPYLGKSLTIQGNHGIVSHNDNYSNEYAWDFDMTSAADGGIYAARAGRVTLVQEAYDGNKTSTCTKNGNPSECGNNKIHIVHQDGTYSHYLHGAYKATAVEKGDIVKRGQYLGESGNVGNSLMKHIHFSAHSAHSTESGPSVPSAFDDQSEPCVKPDFPDTKESSLTHDVGLKYLLTSDQGWPHKRLILPPPPTLLPPLCVSESYVDPETHEKVDFCADAAFCMPSHCDETKVFYPSSQFQGGCVCD